MMYGWCVDDLLKKHAEVDTSSFLPQNPTYMYVFNHRSQLEQLPRWMGKTIFHLLVIFWAKIIIDADFWQGVKGDWDFEWTTYFSEFKQDINKT